MDLIKQRIKIAETCGWELVPHRESSKNGFNFSVEYAFEKDGYYYGGLNSIPDYLNDLNAMHEAFKQVIKPHSGLTSKFGEVLQDVLRWHCVGVVPDYRRDLISLSLLANASAFQRAEVFLKTLSLWETELE